MWLLRDDTGIEDIFADAIIYIESWGPRYDGLATVKHWFAEWNNRGRVVTWDIRQFFHAGNRTVAAWYFKSSMDDGGSDEFDGLSLIEWDADDKIRFLQEYGCNRNNYNPYQDSEAPRFRDEKPRWF